VVPLTGRRRKAKREPLTGTDADSVLIAHGTRKKNWGGDGKTPPPLFLCQQLLTTPDLWRRAEQRRSG
jgi:hypothetical protein